MWHEFILFGLFCIALVAPNIFYDNKRVRICTLVGIVLWVFSGASLIWIE